MFEINKPLSTKLIFPITPRMLAPKREIKSAPASLFCDRSDNKYALQKLKEIQKAKRANKENITNNK